MKKNYLRLVNEDNKINDTERPTHLVQAPFAQTGVFIDPIVAIQLEKLSYEFLPVLQEKNLEWQLAIEPNILGRIDPEKMERAFDNLIRNAIHYSFTNSQIHLSVQKQDEQIMINITNEGKHIPPEKITRIFEPFYRADSARQSTTGGTGLGLPITKEIVELHEGTISAVSEENQISFTVLLPI